MGSTDTVEYAPGQLVGGKYLLVSEIGAGGMGTVWAARNNATDAEVALKIWRDDGRDSDADNTRTLGTGALRWSTVYAGTGTINTSDAREKTPVRPLTLDEINAAKQLSKEIGCRDAQTCWHQN